MSGKYLKAARHISDEFDREFFGNNVGAPAGFTRHAGGTVAIAPIRPYTRWQRLLHRLRICRWHSHAGLNASLTLNMIDLLMEQT